MKKKQFKTESKKLLDMMINSIYTHKEIFLRELISNASDAIDKLYFRSLTDQSVAVGKENYAIHISINKDKRTLTISDNGCGMSAEELETNLGTIAKSGSFDFKRDNAESEGVDIIGQFGVGFYSAFMVADKIVVNSKAFGSDEAYTWASSGADGYEILPCDKATNGTEIILKLKENTDDEKYDEFLDQFRIYGLVKKYSDYIKYPIKMMMTKTKPAEKEGDAPTQYFEEEILNSMVPIWRKNKSELKDEDYNNFYKEKFFDFTDPIAHIHTKVEGNATYNALLYIPSKAPYDYYSKEYEKGLQLYSSGVLIMDKCADLLPDHFSFVKGLVDSEDLSLNISREMLQHDRQLKLIAKSLERTIKNELTKMLKNDREKYETFYKAFGLQLKFGVYNNYGMNKDSVKDLLMFYSSTEKKLVTLEEYVTRMPEDQKYIYYACGETVEKIDLLPQTELVKDKGYEILYFTDSVDEFAIKMLMNYKEKDFKSVSAGDLDIDTPEEKEELSAKSEEAKDLFKFMEEKLAGKVKSVKLSKRLKSHPVCLSSEGEVSVEMEKILNSMPSDQKVSASKVLEINPDHPVFETLKKLHKTDDEKLEKYSRLLYNQALLIEGMPVENPVEFSNLVCELMV